MLCNIYFLLGIHDIREIASDKARQTGRQPENITPPAWLGGGIIETNLA